MSINGTTDQLIIEDGLWSTQIDPNVAHDRVEFFDFSDGTRLTLADAIARGLRVIIAGAGGAAHLPGMLAAVTPLPVIGVPVPLRHLDGMDSLLSIVQMPAGVPVATFAIGAAGATNAALCAAAILANKHPATAAALEAFRERQTAGVLGNPDPRTPART